MSFKNLNFIYDFGITIDEFGLTIENFKIVTRQS